jgi:hypothetical protein
MLSNTMPSVHTRQFESGHSAGAFLMTGTTMTVKQDIDCGGDLNHYDILFTAPHSGTFTYHYKSRNVVVMESEYWVEDDKGNIYRPDDDKFTSVLDLEELDVESNKREFQAGSVRPGGTSPSRFLRRLVRPVSNDGAGD